MPHETHSEPNRSVAENELRPTRLRGGFAALAGLLLLVLAIWPTALSPGESWGRSLGEPGGEATDPAGKDDAMSEPTWADVDELIANQQFQKALDFVVVLQQDARAEGNDEALLKALVRETQLRSALHGYETAVRSLLEARESGLWPSSPEAVLVHRLFYAQTLRLYQQAYRWQIRQRERTTGADADLDQWTMEQVSTEIHEAFLDAWKLCGEWGSRPLGDMARYLEQNNYPARIRGTLRDSVSHLWVETLEDQSLWSPAQSNEVWKLDLEELLRPRDADETAAVDVSDEMAAQLRDPEVHPLQKIAFLLTDLEAWHLSGTRPEAAFDARRTLLGKLRSSFSGAEHRGILLADLKAAMTRLSSDFPWWTMGQADLAEFVAGTDRPWALRDARNLALLGRDIYPESAGARRCAALVEGWEAPNFTVQAMAADGPARRSVLIQHANLPTLYFRAVPWDIDRLLRTSRDRFLPDPRDVVQLLKREPLATWTVELPLTPDLRHHQTYVTPPLSKLGSYLLIASTDPSFDSERFPIQWVDFRITEMALLQRNDDGELVVDLRSAEHGEPLQNVPIEVWKLDWRKGHELLDSRPTNRFGVARFGMANQGSLQVVAVRGEDRAHLQTWSPYTSDRETEQSVLIYTDRAIYRPGQTIQWKIVAFEQGPDGQMTQRADETIEVQLSDENGEVVAEVEVTTNRWGSASGTFEIGSGRALGEWSIETSWDGWAGVRVEEYKRPTFEVEIKKPDESLRFGESADVTGEARYYFGAPVTDGKVQWQVTRSTVRPAWWGWRLGWWNPLPPVVVASGETRVEPDGSFHLSFLPEADPMLADRPEGRLIPYAFEVQATVVDPGGETREGSETLHAGFVTTQASIETPTGLLQAEERVAFKVWRTNLEGAVAPGEGTWRLHRLEPPAEPILPHEIPADVEETKDGEFVHLTPGDLLRPRWTSGVPQLTETLSRWHKSEAVASGSLTHADAATEELAWDEGLEAGAYALVYETEDDRSKTTVTAESFLAVFPRSRTDERTAASSAQPLPLPLPLYVAPVSDTAEVGESAEVLVLTGWTDQSVVVTMWSRDGRELRRILPGGAAHRIRVPVEAKHRGRLMFEATLVRDHVQLTETAYVAVPWTDKQLQVELSSFRDLLRPGANETWTVTVRDASGEPLSGVGDGAAEVLASMYDRSLDIFAPHRPAKPEDMWPRHVTAPGWNSSVGRQASGRRWGLRWRPKLSKPVFVGDRLRLYDGYPIGGPGVRRHNRALQTMAKLDRYQNDLNAEMEGEAITVTAEAPMLDSRKITTGSTVQVLEEVAMAEGQEPPTESEPPSGEGLRSDFSETAFWEPHLLLTDDGSVSFEFEVPDAVTEWRVWLRALADEFRAGSFETTVRSSKDLLVRPYLPRFFREGDQAELRVVVSNQGEAPLSGELDFDIVDPVTETSRLSDFGLAPGDAENVPFDIEAGGQTTLRFAVTAPKQPGEIAVRVLGRAESAEDAVWSDGELRPLPVLPSRLYLSQSRFAVLDRPETRALRFDDLLDDDDPTRDNESLVMTLDGQLLTTVLNALPYLVEYPYSCTEQSLNRFVSTGIVSSVFSEHPMVAEMAKGLSEERDTQFETWQADDPNRKMLLEETPWLRESRGQSRYGESDRALRKILDPAVAAQVRDESLERVLEAQTASGGFPWWPGGPPSPFMTLYVLDSFSRALEFGVEVPKNPTVRAWKYLETYFRNEMAPRMADQADCCLPLAVYLNWMLSNFPEDEQGGSWTGGYFTEDDRVRLLDYGFARWRELAPRLKGYLALTLTREDRGDDARLVWDSVMDSAKTDEDLGTYWAPEKMAWLWYNDTIETHAFALRVLGELSPDDERLSGLAQWLLVQKKLSHWKSTRATAEVLYSLVHYLKSQDLIGIREEATVRVGRKERHFVFAGPEAQASDRRQQWIIEGDEMKPAMGKIEVSKETEGFLMASATWHFATDQLPEKAEGDLFRVERKYFRRVLQGDEWTLEPLAEGARIAVGDQLEVQLDIRADHAAEYVHLRDPRGAGFEPEDLISGYRWETVGHYREIRDSATNFFFEWLPAGQYVLKYRVRAATAGTFRVGPAQLQSMYAPEFVAYSTGEVLSVAGE